MKIISKYKDFYDFIAQDHDADITYVRKPFLVYKDYTSLYSGKIPGSHTPSWGRYWSYFSEEPDTAKVSNFVFGIYPYVYSQPVLYITLQTNTLCKESFYYPLSKSEVGECLSKKKEEAVKYLEKIANIQAFEYARNNEHIKIPKNIKTRLPFDFNEFYWKVECPDIFMKIGAPVFIRDNGTHVNFDLYGIEFDRSKIKYYLANFWFTKLSPNLIKCWLEELMDLNTYINIENYLWAAKKEPESVPDNNTKIINHGFDLKTSFRKM